MIAPGAASLCAVSLQLQHWTAIRNNEPREGVGFGRRAPFLLHSTPFTRPVAQRAEKCVQKAAQDPDK